MVQKENMVEYHKPLSIPEESLLENTSFAHLIYKYIRHY